MDTIETQLQQAQCDFFQERAQMLRFQAKIDILNVKINGLIEFITRTETEQQLSLNKMDNGVTFDAARSAANRVALDNARSELEDRREDRMACLEGHKVLQMKVSKLYNKVQELMGL
jgi:hypothetical protein